MYQLLRSELVRNATIVVVALVGVATVALANRNMYTKEQIIDKFEAHGDVHDMLDREISHIRDDVQWLVRNSGGVPSVDAEKDNDTP